MILALLLLVTPMSEAGPSFEPPALLADVTVERESTGQPVPQRLTLSGVKRWEGQVLAEGDPRDPVSTALRPRVEKGPGRVVWLAGHALTRHEQPGDTVVTYALLLQAPAAGGGEVRACWYEDHKEVPTSLWCGGGTVEPGRDGGAARFEATLKETEVGEPMTIRGLVRGL